MTKLFKTLAHRSLIRATGVGLMFAGQPVGGWHPEETVTRETALDGYTRTAAYAAFAEDRLGTLMPGMRADFVMLESDPLLASPRLFLGEFRNYSFDELPHRYFNPQDTSAYIHY